MSIANINVDRGIFDGLIKIKALYLQRPKRDDDDVRIEYASIEPASNEPED